MASEVSTRKTILHHDKISLSKPVFEKNKNIYSIIYLEGAENGTFPHEYLVENGKNAFRIC